MSADDGVLDHLGGDQLIVDVRLPRHDVAAEVGQLLARKMRRIAMPPNGTRRTSMAEETETVAEKEEEEAESHSS